MLKVLKVLSMQILYSVSDVTQVKDVKASVYRVLHTYYNWGRLSLNKYI